MKTETNKAGLDHIPGQVVFNHVNGPQESYVLTRWHKKVGDIINPPEIIATLETASFYAEIESCEIGVVEELCFKIGETIPDGAVIARIRS